MFWAGMPRPTDSAPCGSRSTSSTLRPCSTSAAPRLIVDVVLPTPPFWLHMAMIRAGPCEDSGAGIGKLGIGRPVGPRPPAASPSRPSPESTSCAWSVWSVTIAPFSGLLGFHRPVTAFPPIIARHGPRLREVSRRVANRSTRPTLYAPDDHAFRSDHALRSGVSSRGSAHGVVPGSAGGGLTDAEGAGMGGGVDLAQMVGADPGVDLRRRHRSVAEQLLHHADVGAALEQVGRERVPHRVRRHVRAQPGPSRGLLEHGPRTL